MTVHPGLDVARWDDTVPPDIIVTDGTSQINVHAGHLVIRDGVAGNLRTRRLTRSQRKVKTIVNLAQHGYITWEAYAWMRACGIAFVNIQDSPRYTNWEAVRGQVNGNSECAGYLIRKKIGGCAANLVTLGRSDDAMSLTAITVPADLQGIKNAEARAARRYWKVWRECLRIPWSASDAKRVPAHWRIPQLRESAVRAGNREATDPLNAMLNYAYKVGETACRDACVSAGLDPALGILHVPADRRDSFVYDLLEPIRPLCDARVIRVIQSMSVFDHRWVRETGKGVCRLNAPLTHTISGWQSSFYDAALPVAVEASRILRRENGHLQYTSESVRSVARAERDSLRGDRPRARDRGWCGDRAREAASCLSWRIRNAGIIRGRIRFAVSELERWCLCSSTRLIRWLRNASGAGGRFGRCISMRVRGTWLRSGHCDRIVMFTDKTR